MSASEPKCLQDNNTFAWLYKHSMCESHEVTINLHLIVPILAVRQLQRPKEKRKCNFLWLEMANCYFIYCFYIHRFFSGRAGKS